MQLEFIGDSISFRELEVEDNNFHKTPLKVTPFD